MNYDFIMYWIQAIELSVEYFCETSPIIYFQPPYTPLSKCGRCQPQGTMERLHPGLRLLPLTRKVKTAN